MENGKGLFLTHEGIGKTIFESQVLRHVDYMKMLGVSFDVLTFEVFKSQRSVSIDNLNGLSRKDIFLRWACNMYIPFSIVLNILFFVRFLKSSPSQYSFIHARADYSAFVAVVTKVVHGIPVIWDCRGESVDELKDALKSKNVLLRFTLGIYLILSLKFMRWVLVRYSDKAIFVSDALKDRVAKGLQVEKSYVIPCLVSEDHFYYSSQLRRTKRLEIDIQDDEVVYIYSGSMVAYQGMGLYKDVFDKILSNPSARILVLTVDVDYASVFFSSYPKDRIMITSSSFDKVNEYYNAADVALLLREEKLLNYVASPTKFGEYCMSGLPVVLNGNVQQAEMVSREIGNHISAENCSDQNLAVFDRSKISELSRKWFSRRYKEDLYERLYSF